MRKMQWVIIMSALFLSGCGTDWSDPRAVVSGYLSATYRQDLKKVYQHLSSKDQAVRSLEQFIRYDSTEDSIVVGPLMRRTTFEIESIEIDGDRGRAIVRVRQPDMEMVMNDMFNAALSSIGSGMSPGEFDRLLEKRYSGRPVPMVTVRKGVGLVRETGGWRISAGWPREEETGILLSQASMLEQSGDLKGAKVKYEEALVINENLIELKEKIGEIEFKMKPAAEAHREFQEYVNKMLEDRGGR